ncbi:MAG: beta-ketoacyl-ACP synthase III [Gemmatimonadetes bacterium]|nr:beta-ketoacyl-ACP synthase III [Gemmatimonadota bacterium]
MRTTAISGTGLYTPPQTITNDELVESFNAYVQAFNQEHVEAIGEGTVEPLQPSSSSFVEKASGIKSRHVVEKSGILDIERMVPNIPERPNEEPSILCEMAVASARDAMRAANKTPDQIDAVIVGCSNLQRPYPAIAIEVQRELGIDGFGFDMNVACSSATFAIQVAADMVACSHARAILAVNPEICTAHLNFRDRDSHFIFGDVSTAAVVESKESCAAMHGFEIVGTKLSTRFSSNVRNNFGFLNRAAPEGIDNPDKLFVQQGRKVFKEVVPLVSDLITTHLAELGYRVADMKRMWLHQANRNMIDLIGRRVWGREPSIEESPVILDEYANTSSAGSIIAFHRFKSDLEVDDLGLICSFGAGYSVGSVVLRKIS